MSTPGRPAASDHETWEELAVGYALDALEPGDDQAFRDHLRTCDTCAQTIADTQSVMTDLAYAAEPVEPPRSLKEAIRSGIEASDRRPLQPFPTTRTAQLADPLPFVRPTARADRRRSLLMARPWMAVAASVVVLLSLVLWNVVLQADNSVKRRQLLQASAVTRCVSDASCRTVPILDKPGGTTRATALVRGSSVSLLVTDLPRNDRRAGTYWLWQVTGSSPDPVPVQGFDVLYRGTSVVAAGTLRDPSAVKALAISREPSRNLPVKPTTVLGSGTVAS